MQTVAVVQVAEHLIVTEKVVIASITCHPKFMNILIVEDDLERIEFFMKYFPNAFYTNSAYEAVEYLKNNKVDILYLDHDLHWQHYVKDTDNEFCGNFVASFLKNNPDISINKIYIHSLNYKGVTRMVENLKDRNVRVVPFLIGRTKEWAEEWIRNFKLDLSVARRDTYRYFHSHTNPNACVVVEIDNGIITKQDRLITSV